MVFRGNSDISIKVNKHYRNLNRILVVCLLIITDLSGCRKDNLEDKVFLETRWTLSYIQDRETLSITQYPADATKSISIVFNDAGNILSFWGICNNGGGTFTYSAANGSLRVYNLVTTLIGCKYVEWETYTLQGLYYAREYKIDGKNLAIYSSEKNNLFFTSE